MDLFLVYVRPVCKNTDGTFEYDFFFSETPDIVWGPDWEMNCPASSGDITPDSTTYSLVKRLRTTLPLKTLEETTCYSMEYATFGMFALSWIDIENLDEYPESGRMALHFGDSIDDVETEVKNHGWTFLDNCKKEL